MRIKKLRDVPVSMMEERMHELTPDLGGYMKDILQSDDGHERGGEETLTPETFFRPLGEETRRQESERDPVRQETPETHSYYDSWMNREEEEEREGRLVAGITPREKEVGNEERKEGADEGENIKSANRKELKEREEEDHTVVRNLTPPLSTSSASLQPPPVLLTPTSQPLTSFSRVYPQASSPPLTPDPSESPALTVDPDVKRSILLLEDLLSQVFHSPGPGHQLQLNELEEKPDIEDAMVKSLLFKPAWKEETTSERNKKEDEFIPKVHAATPKTKTEPKDSKEPRPALRITEENNPRVKPVQGLNKINITKPTGEPQLVENDTKVSVKRNKASPPPSRPSVKQQPTTKTKTASNRPTKSGKNKTMKTSKDKKKKKDNKTQKTPQKKKEVITPTYFPYFMDNYCPQECACYGRVVQCSDKGVDKVPYGIPYNARYILLMNNRIDSIQLDLLDEYVSMEFLVLSNNRLTDGSIEGAFEGIPALKRLYLDRNFLESVPNDLPVSLEELRLDNNHVSVMSEAVWARCPGLLVLSLSNNSLGNGSESLPDKVLSPLSNLRTLNLDHNQLKSVPLGLPCSIKELYFKGNLIEHFRGGAFNGRSELVLLDLSANRLTNKGLSRDSLVNATLLESLNLEGNRLKQVPKHLPRSLKTLNLEGNLITSVKKAVFSTLKNLEHLGLARNKIFKVAPGAFKALLVLHQLDLCYNTLRQVPRQLPQALHSVALTHNRIQSVPRDAFCWGSESPGLSGLVRVQLENNLIDMGRLDAQAFRCLRGFQVVHFY
ncbi:extracellular matrix protein 2 [Notolabrus celidotus]|uniref:extracellular matrix protein 2 n=1 Tax=Notolabrus celidotus TaxID=1203425 RepID=UPI00149032E0|nr:extracellular matrix protein 2 [Notolabrus celidotus]